MGWIDGSHKLGDMASTVATMSTVFDSCALMMTVFMSEASGLSWSGAEFEADGAASFAAAGANDALRAAHESYEYGLTKDKSGNRSRRKKNFS